MKTWPLFAADVPPKCVLVHGDDGVPRWVEAEHVSSAFALRDAERKVIEAAKALYACSGRANPGPYLGIGYTGAIDSLYDSVEDLQAAEKDDS
jgi:hypothetical protein